MLRRLVSVGLVAGSLLVGTTVPASAAPSSAGPHRVRLIGERVLAKPLEYAGTTVGGLSGLDYDRRTGDWVLISDDRSDKQPARFYTARIDLAGGRLGEVKFTGTAPLRRPDGSTYPPLSRGDGTTPDPEDIRIDPLTGNLWWSSEGDRLPQNTPPVLIDPAVRQVRRDGSFVSELPLPANLRMSAADRGPRRNEVLEGLAFAAGGALVVSAMEGPLIQDGPAPTPQAGALTRLTVQTRAGHLLSQYAYPAEPVFATPNPPTGFATNGVVAVLAVNSIDPFRYLVMERSFVTGVGNRVRIYEINTFGATDIKRVDALATAKKVKPVAKKLLVDLADLPLSTVDNIEGMAWGPVLPSGERTLVLVSDDNFSPTQVNQVIALAVR